MSDLQQFFVKGALTIVGSRVTLPQAFTRNGDIRQNKWVRNFLEMHTCSMKTC
jgi:autophagy-related protein 13